MYPNPNGLVLQSANGVVRPVQLVATAPFRGRRIPGTLAFPPPPRARQQRRLRASNQRRAATLRRLREAEAAQLAQAMKASLAEPQPNCMRRIPPAPPLVRVPPPPPPLRVPHPTQQRRISEVDANRLARAIKASLEVPQRIELEVDQLAQAIKASRKHAQPNGVRIPPAPARSTSMSSSSDGVPDVRVQRPPPNVPLTDADQLAQAVKASLKEPRPTDVEADQLAQAVKASLKAPQPQARAYLAYVDQPPPADSAVVPKKGQCKYAMPVNV